MAAHFRCCPTRTESTATPPILESVWTYIAALLPSAGLLFMLYLVVKYILEGDRRERMAQAEWDREHPESQGVEESEFSGDENSSRSV